MNKLITWVLVILLHPLIFCEEWYEQNNPNFVTSSTIQEAVKDPNSIKIVKFFTPWCKYCRVIKRYIDEYKQSHELDQGFKIYDLNCDNSPPGFCARNYYVSSFPALIIFDENGNQIYRISGLYPK